MASIAKYNARVVQKHDTSINWNNATNFIPLAGEITIAAPGDKLADVDTGTNESGASIPCLIKVGDGAHKFSELPWLSALAADVHTWAKMPESNFKTWLVSENGPALATQSQVAALDDRVDSLTPATNNILVAESLSWLRINGNPEKMYFISSEDGSGGMLYACSVTTVEGEGPVNMIDEVGYTPGLRLTATGDTVISAPSNVTGFIPVAPGDTVTVENWQGFNSTTMFLCMYNADQDFLLSFTIAPSNSNGVSVVNNWCTPINNQTGFEFIIDADSLGLTNEESIAKVSQVAYFRLTFGNANNDHEFGDEEVHINLAAYVQGTIKTWYAIDDIATTVEQHTKQILVLAELIAGLMQDVDSLKQQVGES